MRATTSLVLAAAVCGAAAGCSRESNPPPRPPARTATASASASASPGPTALPAGTTTLDCSDPIGRVASPTAPYRGILDAVGLDTATTMPVGRGDATDRHRLWTKAGLLVHAGRESTLTVPAAWATRVAIAWGNHAAEWTTRLHIPACPEPPSGSGVWLAFPGGISLDRAACVPLRVDTASRTTTVYLSAGARCGD